MCETLQILTFVDEKLLWHTSPCTHVDQTLAEADSGLLRPALKQPREALLLAPARRRQ